MSTDHFGQGFAKKLIASGGLLGSASVDAPTALAMVALGESGNSYHFYRQGVADRAITVSQALAAIPESAQLLHTGCLTLLPEDWPQTQELLQSAKRRGLLVSVDVNLRLAACADTAAYRQCVWQAVACADILKCSDEDLAALGLPQLAPEMAAQQIFTKSKACLIAITCGASGAHLFTRTEQSYSAVPAGLLVSDTVGAGDCFYAAMLAWLARQAGLTCEKLKALDNAQMQQCVLHAVHAAGISVTRAGCNPATWQETCAAIAMQTVA